MKKLALLGIFKERCPLNIINLYLTSLSLYLNFIPEIRCRFEKFPQTDRFEVPPKDRLKNSSANALSHSFKFCE